MVRPILDASEEALRRWLAECGQPSFRARQIRQWIAERRAVSFDQMTDLPISLREALANDWTVLAGSVAADSVDVDGTRKLLVRLADSRSVECVLIPERDRRTVCMSTQVGCGMGCVFCASGLAGVERNLTTGEMIEQLLRLRNLLPPEERLSNIVVMGMGEPLANLEALLPALDFATSAEGLGISARHVTVSTVGLPAKIRAFAESGKPYHLAVSLHAPNDELRRQIVPTAEKITLVQIIDAADFYRAHTSRQVTFEYVLLAGINDQVAHARQLAALLAGRDAFVNLIPFNPVPGLPYRTPPAKRTAAFTEILEKSGLHVRARKRKGAAINAACGQLRRSQDQVVALDTTQRIAMDRPLQPQAATE